MRMRDADFAILAAILAVAIGICMAMFLRPSKAEGVRPVEFADEPAEAAYEPPAPVQPVADGSEIEPEPAERPEWADYGTDTTPYTIDVQTGPQTPTYGFGVSGDPDGLNSFVGVVEWNGRTETAYSSNVLYHYRTSEWTPDEFGFYRTDDGLYVVGSDDYEMGSVIETSRGPALVADCGGDPGITDFYVNWP